MTYQAFVKNSSAARDITFATYDMPMLAAHQCLVKVKAVGVCGSDLHMFDGHGGYDWVSYPLVLGHEVTGEVVEVGEEVDNSMLHKRVVINPYTSCGTCEFCIRGETNRCDYHDYKYVKTPTEALRYGFREPGGLAQYMVADAPNLIEVTDAVLPQVAAISEALTVSYTALKKVANYASKRILIVGPGPIGLGVAALLIGEGNTQTDMVGTAVDHERLALAEQIGVRVTYINFNDVEQPNFTGYDAVIDCSGHPSVPKNSLRLLKRGGQLVLVGINPQEMAVPMDQIVRGEIHICGSYGITKENFEAVLQMATNEAYPFDALVTEMVPFAQTIEGFEKALNKSKGKIVIHFEEETV